MHLVQTPGETVYEIKLADLLCSVALEPKTFLKYFSSGETSVEVKIKQTKKNQQQQKPPDNNKPKPTIILMVYLSVLIQIRKKRWEEKGEENFSRLLQDGDYLCFKDRNLIYVEIHAIWTKITFSKHLLDWKRSYLFSRLINPMSLATLKYSGQARGLYLLRQIWVKNSWFPCFHAAL